MTQCFVVFMWFCLFLKLIFGILKLVVAIVSGVVFQCILKRIASFSWNIEKLVTCVYCFLTGYFTKFLILIVFYWIL